MSSYTDIRRGLSSIQALERELHLKQLQVNRLLNITQAINNNVSSNGLFNMYNSFLSWEIGVKKMVLYIRGEEEWYCATSIGIKDEFLKYNIQTQLTKYQRMTHVEETEHPLISQFDVVIPVRHKDSSIAYVLIGGFGAEDDMYNKVQFITTITNVIAVAIENKRLFKRQLEQERLKREMELASEMQRMLIPQKLAKNNCYELSSIYKPHLGVGGDYFDFVEFNDGKIYFCVGDISGKGVAAALLMANFQANFHTLIKNLRLELDKFIRELNCSVNLITQGERFITFFIAEYDTNKRQLRYVNAGHNPPVMIDGGEVHFLTKGCTILGSFQTLPSIEIGEIQLKEEALVLTYTDGLTDIQNEAGEYLNEEVVAAFAKEHYQLSAKTFNQKLLELSKRFMGADDYPDDFTVLSCKILNC